MSWVDAEYGQVDLGDRRLNRRVLACARAIAEQPRAGFPQIFEDESQLEGHYRLMNNERANGDLLLAPHRRRSWERAAQTNCTTVLLLQDTTEFVLNGEVARVGLMTKAAGCSFYGHFSLAVSEDELPVVHGVVAQGVYRVEDKLWIEGQTEEQEMELLVGSDRWLDVATRASAMAPESMAVIHVMDREADDYALMSKLQELGDDFVIRSTHNRVLSDCENALFDVIETRAQFAIGRTVQLSRRGRIRPPGSKRTHPVRDSRGAQLMIRACTVELRRPAGVAPVGNPSQRLSFVEVTEVNPPEGETPVCWRLLSTLPIETQSDIERIVDIYRKRWLVEEFFKALKTGCSAEKRQGRSLHSLWNTIALLVPIACRLLRLRVTTRSTESHSYKHVIDDIELLALRELVPKRMLKRTPSAVEVMLAIARVGGHLKSNGEPGWLTLGRGMEELHTAANAWKSAMKMMGHPMVSEL